MKTPRKLSLASAAALVTLLAPLSAQQDWVAWTTVDGASQTDRFSFAMQAVGDWNQDGYDDYAVSSPGSDAMYHNGGMVTIHSGENDSILLTIDAMNPGEQLGFSLANLGTHGGDSMPKLAIGAPFANTANGPFSGLVRIYAWDNVTSTLSMVDEINGDSAGMMFGASLAAFDRDGDSEMDLAVGAIGANFQDGQVLTFEMSSAGVALPAADIFDGDAGSGQMFGWALSRVNADNFAPPGGTVADDLVVGVPFADGTASEAGAVFLIDETGAMTELSNPFDTNVDAHLGYCVSAGLDALGDFTEDIAAGAPGTAFGNVLVWSGEDLALGRNLIGIANGDRYGFSAALIPDTNFDDRADVAVGAPGFSSNRGVMRVSEAAIAGDNLYTALGISGSNAQFGFTVASIGDINQTGKMEVAVGTAWIANNRGRLETFAPPAQDIGPITLLASGSFNWATDAVIDVTNLSEGTGGDLYWYVGTHLGDTVSNDGFDVNITNGGAPPTRFAQTVSPGTSDQRLFPLDDHIDDGTVLYFQLIEDRNGFVRNSDVDGGMVHDPGVSIFVEGNQAPGTIVVKTRWGHFNSPIYLYATPFGFTAGAVNSVPGNSWKINLRNSRYIGSTSSTDISGALGDEDEGDFTSNPIPVPPAASGRTIHFQAYDWDLFNPQLTNVLGVDFQ
ncbi:MAG: hypothetical protein GY747_03945 [Planctomycetes bacterium]|nr:hypothetical protein [Planctomycetota bacterium]MCP4770956.1 hypothetical protein [Planctomycetota bacterium]MCP4861676.1 hypothetical protein [Planctomycetota bacterium]